MSIRVQVILDEAEVDEIKHLARSEGLSLSAWFREAGRERVRASRERERLSTVAVLESFFAACDQRQRGEEREPNWEEHLRVIEDSRSRGLP